MKLILFIGHHKIGSTALQSHLARHAAELLARGVLYPAVEGQGMAAMVAGALGRPLPQPLPVNVREAHNALAFSMIADRKGTEVPALHEGLPPTGDMLCAIRRQIEILRPDTVILAAEVFANFASFGPTLIERLAGGLLEERGEPDEVTLVATFRRVDDYLASWHGQRLRFGQKVRPLSGGALGNYMRGIHFDYRRMLEAWIEVLPDARRRIRPYGAVLEAGGAVADFIGGLGLPRLGEGEPQVNRGLHRALFEIARAGNHALPREAAQDLFRALLQLGPELELPRSADVELYGPQVRAEMAERFAPIHDWLGEVSGSAQNGHPFFADAAEIGRVRPVPEAEANRLALAELGRRSRAFDPELQAFLAGLEPAAPA